MVVEDLQNSHQALQWKFPVKLQTKAETRCTCTYKHAIVKDVHYTLYDNINFCDDIYKSCCCNTDVDEFVSSDAISMLIMLS